MFHRIHSIARRERGRKSNSPRERALPGEYRIRKAADPSAQYAGERDAEEPLGNFLTTGCATWEQFARPVTFLSSTVNGYSGRVRPYASALVLPPKLERSTFDFEFDFDFDFESLERSFGPCDRAIDVPPSRKEEESKPGMLDHARLRLRG